MSPKAIYDKYQLYFSGIQINKFYSYGKNAIRLELQNGKELIFTYGGKDDWNLETFKHFINRMKGD